MNKQLSNKKIGLLAVEVNAKKIQQLCRKLRSDDDVFDSTTGNKVKIRGYAIGRLKKALKHATKFMFSGLNDQMTPLFCPLHYNISHKRGTPHCILKFKLQRFIRNPHNCFQYFF